MIKGSGVDIIEVQRIADLLERHPSPSKIFTKSEIDGCQNEKFGEKRTLYRFAGLFAAKEAVMKALGTGWTQGAGWTEIIISHTPNGAPQVELKGKTKELAESLGIERICLSISHSDKYALAFVITEG